MRHNDMTPLIGKKINRLSISEGEKILAFDTDQGVVAFETDADCCSETWFADLVGVHALIGGTVSKTEEIELSDYNVNDGRGRQEEDCAYGFKVVTDKGVCDIIFRNSSNGYYGGSIVQYDVSIPDKMTDITQDWQA